MGGRRARAPRAGAETSADVSFERVLGLRTKLGVISATDVRGLGALLCASARVRSECVAQSAWRTIEARDFGDLEAASVESQERAAAARVRLQRCRRDGPGALADAMRSCALEDVAGPRRIHSWTEVSYFVRAELHGRVLWEGRIWPSLNTWGPVPGFSVKLDLSPMWRKICDQNSYPVLERYLKTPTFNDAWVGELNPVAVFNGFAIAMIAIRDDDRMCPLGLMHFDSCNGSEGHDEQPYTFEPSANHCLAGTDWGLHLHLETRHRSSGGEIESCSFYFAEYEGGVVSDDTWVGGVDEPIGVALNQLTWL